MTIESTLKDHYVGLRSCTDCALAITRRNAVTYRGNPLTASVVFIGEAPGEKEDASGKPFVGPSGQLLDQLLAEAGYQPGEVYFTNTVRCRPPRNRDPHPDEQTICTDRWLYPELRLLQSIRPRLVVGVGRIAGKLLRQKLAITKDHGKIWRTKTGFTYSVILHPSYLLRNAHLRDKPDDPYSQTVNDLRRIREAALEPRAQAGNRS